MVRISTRQMPVSGQRAAGHTCAQSSRNQFAFAKNPLAQRAGGRPRYVIPLNVLNFATTVAIKW